MPDTGAPWNIPYVAGTDLVSDWPTDNQTQSEAIADALTAAGVGIGDNIVAAVKTDQQSTTSTSLVDVTGLTVTITPTSATNKVLVIANVVLGQSGTANTFASLVRDSTAIGNGAEGFTLRRDNPSVTHGSIVYLDSPATTSATVYKVQFNVNSNTGYINRSGATATFTTSSSICAIEVRV